MRSSDSAVWLKMLHIMRRLCLREIHHTFLESGSLRDETSYSSAESKTTLPQVLPYGSFFFFFFSFHSFSNSLQRLPIFTISLGAILLPTMQRRGRSANGSRRRQPLAQTQSSSEDDSSDSGSVTRCICGEIHNVGLMVQCDKCEVWQHCSCIGLLEQDIPEQYYCEECRPENHSWIKQPNGSKRLYHPDGSSDKKQQPKKRMTNNSREADVPLADILLSRAVVNGEGPATVPSDENTKEEVEETIVLPPIVEGIEEAVKRRSRRSVEEAQHAATLAAAAAAAAATAHKRSRSHSTEEEKPAEPKDGIPEIGLEESDTDIKSKRPRRTGGQRSNGDKKLIMPKKQPGRKGPAKRTKNARSRTSTPQLSDNEVMPPQEKVEESSAPAKVRYPSAKMSLWEMNRRAKQILEYISSVQVEMANKPTPLKGKAVEDGSSARLDVPASPASSVSSATTLPLDSHTEEPGGGEQTSLEIMDRLTRELIKFQNKFSTSSYHPPSRQALDPMPNTSSAEDHSLTVPTASNA
ncbi:hypothetical protein K450DRAFT_247148 [Umbelopsis ramanniana AG]|uniref:Zinc finger PHD-type domain-containing protein n=1 Tax=Umbelopsis ramanniana AG TaxID=1314678 RepID=A0AAD5HBY1_UMBRA|nr:uncharacterized protein K450DRAFT_247148 [Umbelopsis ramanniana AG]KAI8578492.1 hypothetical protein K450DRAFT_247148 [Umbelopsis ramanniana AG]